MQLYAKILIISAIFTVGSLIFFYAAFPHIFKAIVKSQTALRPGNIVRKYYLKLPIPLDFRVYFFNISNPEQVQNGEVPDLMEIGPYCYDAYKEKIDALDNNTEDTLTYTPYETYFFNQERSGRLSQDDYVTILNPLTVVSLSTR
uniref:SNMP1a n=1 Tax=Hycleus cichorii TaxID=1270216 RepID=A0A2U9NK43_9CUCU|nr:SNMP1a [Hycleus cichorii]